MQILNIFKNCTKPKASQVLSSYLLQCNEPPWTSYFVKVCSNGKQLRIYINFYFSFQYSSVYDDQWGKSHFNWKIGNSNYHILRTGCYPYIKYHCSKRPFQQLDVEDKFFRVIKVINLGIPCLMYGLAATLLIRHVEMVYTKKERVEIYFLLEEHKGSQY